MRIVIALICVIFSSFTWAKLTNESEISLIKTGGNTDTETYGLATRGIYEFYKQEIKYSGAYNFAQTDNVTSKESWNFGLNYARNLFGKIGMEFGEVVEGDRFVGYSRRYNTDLGLTYTFFKSDKSAFNSSLGYRYTVQKSISGVYDHFSKLRLYADYFKTINSAVKFKYWVEYLPNLTESSDYIVSMEPALEVILAKQLFFKVAYEWKYENTPVPGKSKEDYVMKTSLLATF